MPEGLRAYKQKEKLFYARLVAGSRAFFRAFTSFPRRFAAWSGKRTSIVLVPHTGAPSRRLQISRLGLAFLGLAFGLLLAFATIASAGYAGTLAVLQRTKRELADSRAVIDELRDSAEVLTGSALKFETRLSELLSIAGGDAAAKAKAGGGTTAAGAKSAAGASATLRTASVNGTASGEALKAAGLSALLNMPVTGGLADRELERLKGLAGYLDSATPGLEQIAVMLGGQKDIMSEIPNVWPIQGGYGHVSMYFGQNENPFSSGQWYLHNAIDISTFRVGDPVIATASGKVIDASYDAGLGNCVTIQHSHGFLTRYAHLRGFKVSKGQQVAQGQVIGYLGNTGKTTGPHLHYEVHLGTSVIDPLRFLNVRQAVLIP